MQDMQCISTYIIRSKDLNSVVQLISPLLAICLKKNQKHICSNIMGKDLLSIFSTFFCFVLFCFVFCFFFVCVWVRERERERERKRERETQWGSRDLISLWPSAPWLSDIQCQDFAFWADVICRARGVDVACQHHTRPTHHALLLPCLSFPYTFLSGLPMDAHVYIPTQTVREKGRQYVA